MKPLGLYLHIPFCKQKCNYCDFCSFPGRSEAEMRAYTDRLCKDISEKSLSANGFCVDTVYFGGGTPTLLPTDCLTRILCIINEYFDLSDSPEITLECNPATASKTGFSALRSAGFNRLSIGLQSVHQNELSALGRIHTYSDFEKTFSDARSAGFQNISADLMFGIPEQTRDSFLSTLDALLALNPEHISAYGLIPEEGTPFFDRLDSLPLPDEDTEREMYFSAIERLKEHGYFQYEISNFARPGYQSRHNLKYWNCDPFLGFGPAAYSDFCGARFGNSRDLDAYLRGEDICADSETPSARERMDEYVMLRLRLTEGVIHSEFENRFGCSFSERYGKAVQKYLPSGLMLSDTRKTVLTPEGFYVSNTILSDLCDFSKNS